MSTKGSAATIVQSMKDLLIQWDHTQAFWRDQKSREFGEKFLSPLPRDIASAASAMEEIEAILKKIRSDCE